MYEVLVMAEQLKPLWADHLFPVRLHYLSKNRAYYPTNTDIRNHVYKAHAASVPAVKVGPAPTKNRTVAEQTPQSHFHFHSYIQVNTRQ